MTGMLSSELSSCYKADTRWREATLMAEITAVLEYEDCQAECQVTEGCEGWTWTREDNTEQQNYCFLFSHLGLTFQSPHCISGPPSCLCSKLEACEVEADNLIASLPNTMEERDCRELCESNPGCGYYTWYDTSHPSLATLCLLLSSCSERDTSCTSCHSAPVPCSQAIPPTPSPPSQTSELKNFLKILRGNIQS